ncbi:MAG: LysR family transcriptional regulator [Firmicutes bacterium]|nr:LysR family transcriptional regulator [Bacillota bacterium]
MEIRVLKYFLTIAQEESITRAAEVLHLTQPTLSRQIAQLEEELGVRLIQRGARKINLTEEGLLLRRRAEEIVELADRTAAEVPLQQKEIEGTIAIGGGEVGGMETFLQICQSFREKYPRVNFRIYTAEADTVKERMEQGLVDIGLLLEPVDKEKFNYVRLDSREHYVVLMRTDDPLAQKAAVTKEDLLDAPLILPGRATVQSELENWLGKDIKELNVAFFGNLKTNNAIAAMLGYGYALSSDGGTDLLNPERIAVRPLTPELSAGLVIAWKRDVPFSRATEKLIEYIRNSVTEKE